MVIHTSRPEDVLRDLLNRDLEVSGIEVAGAGLKTHSWRLHKRKQTEENNNGDQCNQPGHSDKAERT